MAPGATITINGAPLQHERPTLACLVTPRAPCEHRRTRIADITCYRLDPIKVPRSHKMMDEKRSDQQIQRCKCLRRNTVSCWRADLGRTNTNVSRGGSHVALKPGAILESSKLWEAFSSSRHFLYRAMSALMNTIDHFVHRCRNSIRGWLSSNAAAL